MVNKKYSKARLVTCYIVAFILNGFLIFAVTGTMVEIANPLLEKHVSGISLDRYKIFAFIGSVFFMLFITKKLGDLWRSKGVEEIGTGVFQFPNPFADPNYIDGPFNIKREIKDLVNKNKIQANLLKKYESYVEDLEHQISQYDVRLRVFIRHHNNANRLINSLLYLGKNKPKSLVNEMLKNVLSECVTILEKDQSDKSISLFEVKEDKLVIREYLRINVQSANEREFIKGEGFAGDIWEKNQSEIVNNIEADERFVGNFKPKHLFKSIMGVPLSIEDEILGVMCIQSENEDGFCEDDLRAVQFYASTCCMLLLYDKMLVNRG